MEVSFGNSDRSRENNSRACFLLEFKMHGLVSPVDRWRCDMLVVLACVIHLLVIQQIDLLLITMVDAWIDPPSHHIYGHIYRFFIFDKICLPPKLAG